MMTKIHENYVHHECYQLCASSTLPPSLFIILFILNFINIASFPHKSLQYFQKKSQLCLSNNHLPITEFFLIPFSIKERSFFSTVIGP